MKTSTGRKLLALGDEIFDLVGGARPTFRCCDLAVLEALEGPPPIIRGYDDFRPYQKWMAARMVRHAAVFIAAEMGLGKTAAVLHAVTVLRAMGEVRRVLIVAPLMVADVTWPEEIAKWTFARGLTYSVLTGDETDRRYAARQDADLHIINRENYVWLRRYWGRRWPYDMLVYDEATRLRSGSKKTSGSIRKDGSRSPSRLSEFGAIARTRGLFKHVVLLSGTPATNGLIDLWGPMYIIDTGRRLGASKTAFLNRWFDQNPYDRSITPHDGAFDEITSRVRDVFFSLKEKDYLTLPPVVPVDHLITLPKLARERYDQMERDTVIEELNLEAVNGGVLTNKLLQMANGSVYDSDGKVVRLHEEKLTVLSSIMEEAAGRPVLLGYSFKFDRDAILKKFPYARIFDGTRETKRDWDAGKIRLLVTHPASAGHGLNLQFGGNIQVWYGLTWSLELYLQFIKRLHRSGQLADRVFLHRILARDTVDIGVSSALARRDADQGAITDAVRVRLSIAKRGRQ